MPRPNWSEGEQSDNACLFQISTDSRVFNSLIARRIGDFLAMRSQTLLEEPSDEFRFLVPSDTWLVGSNRHSDMRARVQAISLDVAECLWSVMTESVPDSTLTRYAAISAAISMTKNYRPLEDRTRNCLDLGISDFLLSQAQKAFLENDFEALASCQLEAWELMIDRIRNSIQADESLEGLIHRVLDIEVLSLVNSHASFNEIYSVAERDFLLDRYAKGAVPEFRVNLEQDRRDVPDH